MVVLSSLCLCTLLESPPVPFLISICATTPLNMNSLSRSTLAETCASKPLISITSTPLHGVEEGLTRNDSPAHTISTDLLKVDTHAISASVEVGHALAGEGEDLGRRGVREAEVAIELLRLGLDGVGSSAVVDGLGDGNGEESEEGEGEHGERGEVCRDGEDASRRSVGGLVEGVRGGGRYAEDA